MAMLSQCFSYYCCMESLGKLPPKRFGHHMVNVSAILRILFWGCQSRGVNRGRGGAGVVSPASGPKTPAHRESGNAGNGLPQTLSVFFFFWGRGVETRCSCCRPPTLCSDKVSRNQRQRSGNRLRRRKAGHRGKAATADNRTPAELPGATAQRKPCGALFANVAEAGGAGRGAGIATPEPTSNTERRCAGQFG